MRFKTKKRIRILLIIQLLIINNIDGQDLKSELTSENKLEAEKIIELPNKKVKEIYKQVLKWTAYTFRNTESVTQSQIENEMLRLNGISNEIFNGPMGIKYGLGYIIQIELKDYKMRFRMYDMAMIGTDAARTRTPLERIVLKNNGKLRTSKYSIKYRDGADNEINRIYHSLIKSLTSKKEKDSDW